MMICLSLVYYSFLALADSSVLPSLFSRTCGHPRDIARYFSFTSFLPFLYLPLPVVIPIKPPTADTQQPLGFNLLKIYSWVEIPSFFLNQSLADSHYFAHVTLFHILPVPSSEEWLENSSRPFIRSIISSLHFLSRTIRDSVIQSWQSVLNGLHAHAKPKPRRTTTERRFILCTWFGEISSCSCLTVLPGSCLTRSANNKSRLSTFPRLHENSSYI